MHDTELDGTMTLANIDPVNKQSYAHSAYDYEPQQCDINTRMYQCTGNRNNRSSQYYSHVWN